MNAVAQISEEIRRDGRRCLGMKRLRFVEPSEWSHTAMVASPRGVHYDLAAHQGGVSSSPFTVLIVIPAVILYFTADGGMALRRPAPWNVLMLVGAAICFARRAGPLRSDSGPVWKDWSRDVGSVESAATPGCGWPISPRPQPDDLWSAVRSFGRGPVFWISAAFRLLCRCLPVEFDLLPVGLRQPGLEKRFGEEYLRYKHHVPRWIPRLTPWRGSAG